MPVIHINVVAGREPERYAELMIKMTDLIEETLGVSRASIRIFVQEVPPHLWSVGGEAKAPPPS